MAIFSILLLPFVLPSFVDLMMVQGILEVCFFWFATVCRRAGFGV